jgi:hypothetical protein
MFPTRRMVSGITPGGGPAPDRSHMGKKGLSPTLRVHLLVKRCDVRDGASLTLTRVAGPRSLGSHSTIGDRGLASPSRRPRHPVRACRQADRHCSGPPGQAASREYSLISPSTRLRRTTGPLTTAGSAVGARGGRSSRLRWAGTRCNAPRARPGPPPNAAYPGSAAGPGTRAGHWRSSARSERSRLGPARVFG